MVRKRRKEVGTELAPSRALSALLKPYDPAVRRLATGLRAIVRSEVAPCHEIIYDASYTVALLYGPMNGRVTDGFCYISVHRRHVNLGFQRGSLLADPLGRLRGAGAWMRHIQIKSTADLDRPEIRAFLRAACEEAEHTPSGGRNPTVFSTVKRSSTGRGRSAKMQ